MAEDIKKEVSLLREFYESGATQPYEFRVKMLKSFRKAVKTYEKELIEAHKADYNKCAFETWAYELAVTYAEIDEAIKKLKEWMKPQKYIEPLFCAPSCGERFRDPYGVVLIVSPFNFAGNLTFAPMVGAIAGGNVMAITPSNYLPKVSEVIKKICEMAFPGNYCKVFLGGHEVKSALFECYFDKSFFTGGTKVGKLLTVSQAAHNTPVVLELGGKSPAYINKDVDMEEAVNAITWAKFANGGMICVNVDYVVVDESVHDKFVETLLASIKKHQYDSNGVVRSNFVSMPSEKQFDAVLNHIDENRIIWGGKSHRDTLLIEPTVLDHVEITDKCMQSEIFGPVLPIITVKDKEEAVKCIYDVGHIYNAPDGAKPLAFYVFSKNKDVADYMLAHVQSGGACVNSAIFHFLGQVFNGVQFSGNSEGYHGYKSFIAFTHGRTVCRYERAPKLHKAIQWAIWQRPVTDKIVEKVIKLGIPIDKVAYYLLWSPDACEVD